MGNVTACDGSRVLGREEFSKWTILSVKRAYFKARAKVSSSSVSVPLKKFEFWECFTDCDTLDSNNQLLALPMSVFDIFAVDPVTGATLQTVDAIEVCMVLAMFCKAPSDDSDMALAFIFRMFDTDDSKSITRAEMRKLLEMLDTSSFKIGLTPRPATSNEMDTLATSMFAVADANNDNSLSYDEFLHWAKGHVSSQQLLDAFTQVRKQEEARLRAEAAEARKRMRQANSSSKVEVNLSDDDRKRLERQNWARAASSQVIQHLSSTTRFTVAELRDLRGKFVAKAKTGPSHTSLSRAQFREIMSQEFPTLANTPNMAFSPIDVLFDAFDLDGDRTIDFKEFTLGMAKLVSGSMQDKLQLMFEVCDQNGDGTVAAEEVLALVDRENAESAKVTALTAELLSTLDKDSDGSVSKDEFSNVLTTKPLLFEHFASSILPGLKDVKVAVANYSASNRDTRLTLPNLFSVLEGYRKRVFEHERLTVADFRGLLEREFGAPPGMVATLTRIFYVYDEAGTGEANWKDLFMGLAQTLDGKMEDRAKFFFALYDTDGSGEMSKDELLRMVLSTQEAVDSTAHDVKSVLDKMDVDGDGSISVDEFQKIAAQDPSVFECFARMFRVGPESQNAADAEQSYYGVRKQDVDELKDMLSDGKDKSASSSTAGNRRVEGIRQLRRFSSHTLGTIVRVLQAEAAQSDTVKPMDAHEYLNCHASMVAREHARQLTNRDIPMLRRRVKHDMIETSARLHKGFDELLSSSAKLPLSLAAAGSNASSPATPSTLPPVLAAQATQSASGAKAQLQGPRAAGSRGLSKRSVLEEPQSVSRISIRNILAGYSDKPTSAESKGAPERKPPNPVPAAVTRRPVLPLDSAEIASPAPPEAPPRTMAQSKSAPVLPPQRKVMRGGPGVSVPQRPPVLGEGDEQEDAVDPDDDERFKPLPPAPTTVLLLSAALSASAVPTRRLVSQRAAEGRAAVRGR